MTVDQLHDHICCERGPAVVFRNAAGDLDACKLDSAEHRLFERHPQFVDSIVGTYDASVSFRDLAADIQAARAA
jgi:hypothetical protein